MKYLVPMAIGFVLLHVLTSHLAKLTNHLEPFSITLGPCIEEIVTNRQKLERFASIATMERVKGRVKPCVCVLHEGGERCRLLYSARGLIN